MASNDSSLQIAAYLRVASIAIALYDYLETMPTAFKFYREHWEHRHFSISILLFVSIRVVSIVTLTISNVGFFYGNFSLDTCSRFYLFPPAFKVLQAMVSQAILGVRAYNLSRRSRPVGWLLLVVYFSATTLQWVTTLYQRQPSVDEARGNCRAFNNGRVLGAWIFYTISIIYDVGITAMSAFYLLKFKLVMKNTMMAKVTKMMMYDGLGYLVVLTGVNVLNILLFKTTAEIQTGGSSLGYCVSWIMTQRLLIHLYDASRERQEGSYVEAVTISQHVGSARGISRVMRSRLDQKHGAGPTFDHSRPIVEAQTAYLDDRHLLFPDDVGLQVRVERTVRRNRTTRTYELEDYSRRTRNDSVITSQVHVGNR